MKNNATSKEFGDKELIMMGAFRRATWVSFRRLFRSHHHGRVCLLKKKGHHTLEASLAGVKGHNHEELKLIMKEAPRN